MAYNIFGIDLICPSLQLQANINQAVGVFQTLLNSVSFAKDQGFIFLQPLLKRNCKLNIHDHDHDKLRNLQTCVCLAHLSIPRVIINASTTSYFASNLKHTVLPGISSGPKVIKSFADDSKDICTF